MEHRTTSKKVVIVTGSSGSGRKTAANKISEKFKMPFVKSYTTRKPRLNEFNNPENNYYHYISEDDFLRKLNNGEFLQTIKIDKGYYGTLKEDIDLQLKNNDAVILVMNREGALQAKKIFGKNCIRVFIYLSKQTLIQRLEAKKTPSDVIDRYIDQYLEEVHYKRECDIVVDNEDLTLTLEKIQTQLKPLLL